MNILTAMGIALLFTVILVGLFPVGSLAFATAATILGGNAFLCIAFGIMVDRLNK
jgi:hypothetical protein